MFVRVCFVLLLGMDNLRQFETMMIIAIELEITSQLLGLDEGVLFQSFACLFALFANDIELRVDSCTTVDGI